MAKKTKSDRDPEKATGAVDLAEVEHLLAFMNKHRLEQFEYERDGTHIMLKKASVRTAGAARSAGASEAVAKEFLEQPVASFLPVGELPAKPARGKAVADDLHLVKSPIVGTFYAAASPDAEPFVRVKAQVGEGQVLCIIEAMKLMNEIEAEASGVIAKMFVGNGSPVEYGMPLFGIRKQ
jgi:acetyl-CoA carboxylase biotin carboxyl carrier protein